MGRLGERCEMSERSVVHHLRVGAGWGLELVQAEVLESEAIVLHLLSRDGALAHLLPLQVAARLEHQARRRRLEMRLVVREGTVDACPALLARMRLETSKGIGDVGAETEARGSGARGERG